MPDRLGADTRVPGTEDPRKRMLALLALVLLVVLLLLSDALYERSTHWVGELADVIDRYPLGGKLLFLALAITSAMLAFFSSAVLVPVGVSAWGPLTCFVLLWCGWLLGGFASYAVGWYFGDAIVVRLVSRRRFETTRARLDRHARFWHIVLAQAALPSEIPGYVLGTLRYRFRVYALALALTEIPYAVATVYIGASLLNRRGLGVFAAGVVFLLASLWIYRRYQRSGSV